MRVDEVTEALELVEDDQVGLEGMDAGVSFQSGVFRGAGVRYSVLSNTSSGAWPLVKAIEEIVA